MNGIEQKEENERCNPKCSLRKKTRHVLLNEKKWYIQGNRKREQEKEDSLRLPLFSVNGSVNGGTSKLVIIGYVGY